MAINGKRFERMAQAVQRIVSDEMKQADILIQPYVLDHLHGDDYRPGIRASVKSKNLYGGKNPTDKLYSETGKLLRSLQPNGAGHIFDVKVIGSSVSVIYGIDLKVIPYARVHEYGLGALRARPYLIPAVKEFVSGELERIINNIVRRVFGTK